MTDQPIAFGSIRAFKGSQHEAFEELCIHLAGGIADEPIADLQRVRGDGGDGGVEAVATTVAGNKIGIQSKFFLASLGTVQWRQIVKSVESALTQHKDLRRYIVCCATNRTPVGIKKWGTLTTGWKKKYPKLKVEWRGATEITGLLALPAWKHLATYWFGAPDFDSAWAATCCRQAIDQLHQRYTPRLHSRTHVEQDLGLLCGLADQRAAYHGACSTVAKIVIYLLRGHELKDFQAQLSGRQAEAVGEFSRAASRLVAELQQGNLSGQQDIPLKKAMDDTISAIGAASGGIRNTIRASGESHRDDTLLTRLHELKDAIYHVDRLFNRYQEGRSKPILVRGEAGSGKSHLLATLVADLLQEQRACLFLLGERFHGEGDLRDQIVSQLAWRHSFHALCECMEAHAKAIGYSSLFIIDAINEAPDRARWRSDLIALLGTISEYSNIQVVMSCRSDWLIACLPDGLLTRLTTVNHRGFDMRFGEAVAAYFEGYHVSSPQYPPLLPEFRNPLFLKTVCEAYEGRVLPAEPLAFIRVMDEWEIRLAKKIELAIDCPASTVRAAASDIVRALADAGGRTLDESIARAICLRHFPEAHQSRSLFRHLCSNGLLQDVNLGSGTVVRLQYERFSDIRIAEVELQSITDKQGWMKHWRERVLPSLIEGSELKDEADARLAAYALILPERIGVELVECPVAATIVNRQLLDEVKQLLWASWVQSLPWRRITGEAKKVVGFFIDHVISHINDDQMWEQLFLLSCIEKHPLNATFLHGKLIRLALPDRETLLTLPLAIVDIDAESGSFLADFLEWAEGSAGRSTDEQAYLCGLMLVWLTSSTNTALRDRATMAAIATLSGRADPLVRIVNDLKEVNDPYIVERLLAVTAGVVPSLRQAEVERVAALVLDWFFKAGAVPPHILQREYAKFIVDFAVSFGAIPPSSLKASAPPFGLSMPTLWTEEQVKEYEDNRAYTSITSSLRPEGMGMYGDFGRYEMGSAVHDFVDPAAFNPKGRTKREKFPRHDDRRARRYIWQRVIELGWTPERYKDYERSLGYHNRERPKIERIGKKYQWIGLHEYLGYLADTHQFLKWGDTPTPFHGAWQTSLRDFDPSVVPWIVKRSQPARKTRRTLELQSPLPSAKRTADRRLWVGAPYESFTPYLKTVVDGVPWVYLYGHHSFEEEPQFGLDRHKTDLMSQWIDVRAFLVPASSAALSLEELSKVSFFGGGIDVPHAHQSWVSEYPWHSTLHELNEACRQDRTWFDTAGQRCFLLTCQIGESQKSFYVPPPSFHSMMAAALGGPLSALRLGGPLSYRIQDSSGKDVFIGSHGEPTQLLVRHDALTALLNSGQWRLAWGVLSEKSAFDGHQHVGGLSTQSAVYWMDSSGAIKGGLTINETSPPEGGGMTIKNVGVSDKKKTNR